MLHPNAGGWSLKIRDIDKLTEFANEELANVDFGEGSYDVDFVFDFSEKNSVERCILDIDRNKGIWGQSNKEPVIAVKNITIDASEIQVMGRNKDTLKIQTGGMEFIKFFAKDLILELQSYAGKINLTVVGKAGINEWMGKNTPQIKIDDIEVSLANSTENSFMSFDQSAYAEKYAF